VLYPLARSFLFALDPEVAHELTLGKLDHAAAFGLTRLAARPPADLPVQAMGLTFRNPIGLAAGMDKNAAHIDALGSFGFGHIEAGTVTPLPQPGNPKPRLFRLIPAQGLINRMGFNNEGVERFVANVRRQRRFRAAGGILGLNIGKNAVTPIERASDDYVAALRAVYLHADYIAVNISSPNTRDLRSLQGERELIGLLTALADERARLEDEHNRRVPMAVKIAPDLDDRAIAPLADVLVAHGVDGVIATNTTLARDKVRGQPHADEAGGLSGRPLRERSTAVIDRLARHLKGALPIIGVGGIMSGADAVEKMQAGAALVQIYTGFIYGGPGLIAECVNAMRAAGAAVPGRVASARGRKGAARAA
jgi:dihydroorotate dehydrogenase